MNSLWEISCHQTTWILNLPILSTPVWSCSPCLMFLFRFQDNKLEIACDNSGTESEKPAPKYNEELDKCCAELLETLKHMVILFFQSLYESVPSLFKYDIRKWPHIFVVNRKIGIFIHNSLASDLSDYNSSGLHLYAW